MAGKSPNRFWRDSTAALGGDGRHSGVVPASHAVRLDQFTQFAFGNHGVFQTAPSKFVLARAGFQGGVLHIFQHPIVNGAIVYKLETAQAVGHAVDCVV